MLATTGSGTVTTSPELPPMTLTAHAKKIHGAYYTPWDVADFLTSWAIRSAHDTVLDPSAGDGVFLFTAAERLKGLGGSSAGQVVGVELRHDTHASALAEAASRQLPLTIHCADFFSIDPAIFTVVDAVVGNPPFIRYQRFAGATRELALRRAQEAGVRLSALTSSWAPFLVHAARFVRPGGRMAVVAPAELAHAGYAQPVIEYLCNSFRDVSVITFDRRLFPHLSEDTVLLMCDGKSEPFEAFRLLRLPDASSLASSVETPPAVVMDAPAVSSGVIRLLQYLLPPKARGLYERLQNDPRVCRLGAVANVGIGYVTGGNDFFHLTRSEVQAHAIEPRFLKRAVRRGGGFCGLVYRASDWRSAREGNDKNSLLFIRPDSTLTPSVKRYLSIGRRAGVPNAYKCRVRQPWYAVPHVRTGDAFLTYMSGTEPRLVVNDAKVVAPNTLHVVTMREPKTFSAWDMAALWPSSIVKLSCELAGHSLGGGMLKLEPSEAASVLLPKIRIGRSLVESLDRAARSGEWDRVTSEIDRRVARVLEISDSEQEMLHEAVQLLRQRRTRR